MAIKQKTYEWVLQDDNYCFPLDILDDHSRFVIRIKPFAVYSLTVAAVNFILYMLKLL